MKTTGIPTWFGVAETASASAPPAPSEFREALGRAQAPPGDPPPAETQSAGEGEVVSIGPNAPEQKLDSTAGNNVIAQILGMTITVPSSAAPVAPEFSVESLPIVSTGLTTVQALSFADPLETMTSVETSLPIVSEDATVVPGYPAETAGGLDPQSFVPTTEDVATPTVAAPVKESVPSSTQAPPSVQGQASFQVVQPIASTETIAAKAESIDIKNEKLKSELTSPTSSELAPPAKAVSMPEVALVQIPEPAPVETATKAEPTVTQPDAPIKVETASTLPGVHPVTKANKAGQESSVPEMAATEEAEAAVQPVQVQRVTVEQVEEGGAPAEVANPLQKAKGKLPDFEFEAKVEGNLGVTQPVKAQAPSSTETVAPSKVLTSSDQEKVVRQVLEHVDYLIAAAPRKEITIRLDPRELGSLLMKISQNGGEVEAKIEATEPAVRAALLDNRPTLDRSLAQKGMVLGDVTVNPQLGSDRNAGQQARNQSSAPAPTFSGASSDLDVNVEETRTVRRSGRDVDLWI